MKKTWKLIALVAILIFGSAMVVHAETTIKFGEYPQTYVESGTNLENALYKAKKNDSNIVKYDGEKYLLTDTGFFKYEPISWMKISGDSSRALLISQYVLDNHSFGKIDDMCVSWNNSDLKNWCNTDFLGSAFTSAEQNCIYLTDVSSCDWGKEDSIHTREKITLPSDELVKSLPETVRQGIGTDYSGKGSHNYYTRCTDSYYGVWNYPIWVTSDGGYNSVYPANWSRGIRPCIVLNLSAAETVEKQQREEKEKEKIKNISNANVTLSATTYKYDGKAKTPTVTIKYAGKKLGSSDYSIKYLNNKYAGTATVEITGKGSYTGTIKKNFTITAGKKIPVTFNGNGGKVSKAKINVSIGAKYGVLPTAKNKGYKFLGWFTAKKGGKQVTKNSYVETTKNQTLYAQWKKESYAITYNLNGGTNSKKNPNAYTVSTKTFSLVNPSRKGYIFKGWYTDSKLKKSIKKITKGSTGNKTLYAKWSAISYNIKFNGNGATSGSMSQMSKVAYAQEIALKKNQFKKSGYVFKGWSTSKGGKIKYIDGQKVRSLSTEQGKTITLFAVWAKTESASERKIYGCIIAGANTKNASTVAEANDFYTKITCNKIQKYSLNKANIKKYVNNSAKPSIAQINKWIQNSFINTTDNDLSYVCYFGHGVCDGKILEKEGREVGLGIYVSDSNKGNVYSYDAFINTLTKNIKGKIVLITNSCYSGGFIDSVKKSSASNRIAVFASSTVNQVSVGDEKGNIKAKEGDYIGAFLEYMNPFNKTYMLYSYIAIDGLTKTSGYSKMDLNKDGKIYGEEYGSYIDKRIQIFDKSFRAPYFLGFKDIPIFQW